MWTQTFRLLVAGNSIHWELQVARTVMENARHQLTEGCAQTSFHALYAESMRIRNTSDRARINAKVESAQVGISFLSVIWRPRLFVLRQLANCFDCSSPRDDYIAIGLLIQNCHHGFPRLLNRWQQQNNEDRNQSDDGDRTVPLRQPNDLLILHDRPRKKKVDHSALTQIIGEKTAFVYDPSFGGTHFFTGGSRCSGSPVA